MRPAQSALLRVGIGWPLWLCSATDLCSDVLKLLFLSTTFTVFVLYVEGFVFAGGSYQFTDWAVAIAHGRTLPATVNYAQRDIGYPLLLWLGGYPYSHSFVGITLIQAVMALAMPVLVYLAVRPLSAPAGYYVAIGSVLSLAPFVHMKWIYHDQAYAFFVLLSVWLLVAYIVSKRPVYLYVGILASLITSLTAPMGNLLWVTFIGLGFVLARGPIRRYAVCLTMAIVVLLGYVYYRHVLFEIPVGHHMPSYAGEQVFYDLYMNSREFGITLSPELGPAMRELTARAYRAFLPDPRRSTLLAQEDEPAAFREKYYYPYTAQQMRTQLYAQPNWEYYTFLTDAAPDDDLFLSASLEIARAHPRYVLKYTLRNLWALLHTPGQKHGRYSAQPFGPEGNPFPLGVHGYTQLAFLPANAPAVKELQFYDLGGLPPPVRNAYDSLRSQWPGIFHWTVEGSFYLMLLGLIAVCLRLLSTVPHVPGLSGIRTMLGRILPTASGGALVAAGIILLENYTITSMFAEPDLRYYSMMEELRFVVAGLGAGVVLNLVSDMLCRFEPGRRVVGAVSAAILRPSMRAKVALAVIVTLYAAAGLASWAFYIIRSTG